MIAELQRANAELRRERDAAAAQTDALGEVLRAIAASPDDPQPVFEVIGRRAQELCRAAVVAIVEYDGTLMHLRVYEGDEPAVEDALHRRFAHAPDTGLALSRAILLNQVQHVRDHSDPSVMNETRREAPGRTQSGLYVPLRRDGQAIGVVGLARYETGGFSDSEVALVESFAEQASLAIAGAAAQRALRARTHDLQEALEQQTATAEVLQVINASPGNLAPVFDAILQKGINLCDAAFGILGTFDGQLLNLAASRGLTPEMVNAVRPPFPPRSGQPTGRLRDGEEFVHILDARDQEGYRAGHGPTHALVDQVGARSALFVAFRRDGDFLGNLVIFRREVRAFSDKEIALVRNFAAQAVIAMENARLINEQREALEQQTATAEVLGVINRSPGDLTPVFDIILEKAMTLCGVAFGMLDTWDSQRWEIVATRGLPPALAEYLTLDRDTRETRPLFQQILETRRPAHRLDTRSGDAYRSGHASVQALADLGGARTFLAIPLLKDDTVTGTISVYRQEVRAFSGREIALLENFAAQAVIAMENARLLSEQREALEQQTATAEVLQVINASPGNLAPVFDAMLEKAMLLCGAACGGLFAYDGRTFQAQAVRSVPTALAEFREKSPPNARLGSHFVRLLQTRQPVHLLDWMDEESYRNGDPDARAMVELGGARTNVLVPLLKDGAVVGFFGLYRQEVKAFTDKQIALLENFAAQAVIAMESARLLSELSARTDELAERQAVLRVTFENMGDGVAMFDETQHLVAWNRNFQDMLDVPDNVIARRQTFAEYIRYLAERGEYGADADVAEQVHRLVASIGQRRVFERTRPDGRVIEIRNNPVAGGGFVVIYADITERKRNEEAIRAARDVAETRLRELKVVQANLIQAEKMASLGQLTAGIAHEIKNPLNFVNNFAELSVDLLGELKDAIAPAEAAMNQEQRNEVDDVVATLTNNLEKITEHGKRADGIVKAMLEHSRGASAERRTVDINALVDEALNLTYHGARAQDQSFNITLEHDFGDGIAPIEVNPQDITRVFLNLFSNGFYAANKRAKSGADGFKPTLRVTTRDVGGAVEILVRDNGTGIPGDIRDKLFQPFFTTKPTGEGTGLGLSITYDIVTKAHGGTITVASEVDQFTEFVVTLPRQMFVSDGKSP